MNRYAAIIDACVLGGGLKRNIILSLAEAGLFRPYWSARILDETERAILAISKGTADPGRQRHAIERAFPEAMVCPSPGTDLLGLLPDPNDEHVLAAAIAARCDTLVTDNLKDFPQGILDRWGIEVMSPDDFISNAMDLDHAVAIGALRDMRARLKDPKYTVSALVLKLEGQGLLQTADFLREYENLI
jgi:predicted nucleic acid-binding protein